MGALEPKTVVLVDARVWWLLIADLKRRRGWS